MPRILFGYEPYTDDDKQESDSDDQPNDLEHKVVITCLDSRR